MTVIKRFIAGAVCPRCGELDKLRTWSDDVKEYRECVSCEYQDAMRLDGRNEEAAELSTRVNQAETAVKPAQPTPDEQVLNLVPMPASASKTTKKT